MLTSRPLPNPVLPSDHALSTRRKLSCASTLAGTPNIAVHRANTSSKVITKVSPPLAAAVPAERGSATGRKDGGGSGVLRDLLLDRDCGGVLGNSDRDELISTCVPVIDGDDDTSMLCLTSGSAFTDLL